MTGSVQNDAREACLKKAQDRIAFNVRRFRRAAGMTQEDLAKASGLQRTYIGGIEQGRLNPCAKNLVLLAQTLNIDPAMLLVEDGCQIISAPDTLVSTMKCGDVALCAMTDAGLRVKPISINDDAPGVIVVHRG